MRRPGQDEEELQAISHISTIDEYIDDYADEPIFKCKNCGSKNSGIEHKEGSMITIIAAVLCVIVFGFYAFLILPLAIETTKTMIRKCIKCDHVLDKQELLSMSSLTDKVLSFKCGNCAVVLSRKYALVAIGILVGIYCLLPARETVIVNPGGLEINTKWEDYVQDCGRKVILNNQMRAKKVFDSRYAKNIVTWSGVFFEHGLIKDPLLGRPILIKMNPSDSLALEFADVQLVFPHRVFSTYKAIIETLNRGDVIQFQAILKAMGDGTHYNYLEAIKISKTGETIDVKTIPIFEYSGSSSLRKQPTTVTPALPSTETPKDTQQTSETTTTGTKKDPETPSQQKDKVPTPTPTPTQKADTPKPKEDVKPKPTTNTGTTPEPNKNTGAQNTPVNESPETANKPSSPTTGTESPNTAPNTQANQDNKPSSGTDNENTATASTKPKATPQKESQPVTGSESANNAATPETTNNEPNPATTAPGTNNGTNPNIDIEVRRPQDPKFKALDLNITKDEKEPSAAPGDDDDSKVEEKKKFQESADDEPDVDVDQL